MNIYLNVTWTTTQYLLNIFTISTQYLLIIYSVREAAVADHPGHAAHLVPGLDTLRSHVPCLGSVTPHMRQNICNEVSILSVTGHRHFISNHIGMGTGMRSIHYHRTRKENMMQYFIFQSCSAKSLCQWTPSSTAWCKSHISIHKNNLLKYSDK